MTAAINGDDDWISVHPGDGDSVERDLVAASATSKCGGYRSTSYPFPSKLASVFESCDAQSAAMSITRRPSMYARTARRVRQVVLEPRLGDESIHGLELTGTTPRGPRTVCESPRLSAQIAPRPDDDHHAHRHRPVRRRRVQDRRWRVRLRAEDRRLVRRQHDLPPPRTHVRAPGRRHRRCAAVARRGQAGRPSAARGSPTSARRCARGGSRSRPSTASGRWGWRWCTREPRRSALAVRWSAGMLACDPSWTVHHVAWIVIGMVPGGSTSRPSWTRSSGFPQESGMMATN